MKLSFVLSMTSLLFLISCSEIDLEDLKDQIKNTDPIAVKCDVSSFTTGFTANFSKQGSDGTCTYDYLKKEVTFTPDELTFSNTDTCEFNFPETSTYRATVDYSDPTNPACAVTTLGGGVSIFKKGE